MTKLFIITLLLFSTTVFAQTNTIKNVSVRDREAEKQRALSMDNEGLKSGLPDYDALARACRNNEAGPGCCLTSVERMRNKKALLAPGDTLAHANCPEGYQPNMLKCPGSHRWCEPVE